MHYYTELGLEVNNLALVHISRVIKETENIPFLTHILRLEQKTFINQ